MSIRDLRNRGGDVVAMAAAGEPVTITRDGTPVAELRALPPRQLTRDQVLARWRAAPPVDLEQLRRESDAVIDPSL